MAFFSGIKARIESVRQSVFRARQAVDKTLSRQPPASQGLNLSFDVQTATAAGSVAAKMTIYLDREIRRELLEQIGKDGVAAVHKALEPVTRTGKTADSFRYRIGSDGQSVVIYSTLPQASRLAKGISGKPSSDDILTWMQSKSEFSGMSDRERKRVSFAIQKSIAKKSAPGSNSTLKSLSPTGQRAFNYFEIAQQQLLADIQNYTQQLGNM